MDKIITSSQMRSFKSCRRRYELEYVELLKPARAPAPLSFGSAYHIGVEALLTGNDPAEAIGRMVAERVDTDMFEALKACEAVKAFEREAPWKEWDIIDVEKEFQIRIDDCTIYQGKKDMLIKWNDTKWVIDHKTALRPDDRYFHHLLWDDQATGYMMHARHEHPDVAGILYIVMAKPSIKMLLKTTNPKYKKDGGLCAGQRLEDETHADYLTRIADWYEMEERLIIHTVMRNPEQLAHFPSELATIADEIDAAKHLGRFYPNPQNCSIFGCAFASICLERSPEAIEGNFVKKDSINEELDIEETYAEVNF